MVRFYEKICNTLLRAIAIHTPGDRRIRHPQVNVLNQRFDLARLLHLSVECVDRFVLVRWNWSKRVFARKHTDFCHYTFSEKFKGHATTYDMQIRRFDVRFKTRSEEISTKSHRLDIPIRETKTIH